MRGVPEPPHPYRSLPPDWSVPDAETVSVDDLSVLAEEIAEVTAYGVLPSGRRRMLAHYLVGLERTQALMAQRITVYRSRVAALAGVCLALAALASRWLPDAWAYLVPLFFVVVSVGLYVSVSMADRSLAKLSRVKDILADFRKYVQALPLDVPVRVETRDGDVTGTEAGADPAEVASSDARARQERKP